MNKFRKVCKETTKIANLLEIKLLGINSETVCMSHDC